MRYKHRPERRDELFDAFEGLYNAHRPIGMITKTLLRERIVDHLDDAPSHFSERVRVPIGLKIHFDTRQIRGSVSPERLDIVIYLIVLVGELHIVLFDVCPPFVETQGRRSAITPFILDDSVMQRFTRSLELSFPLALSVRDNFRNGMRGSGIGRYGHKSVGAEAMFPRRGGSGMSGQRLCLGWRGRNCRSAKLFCLQRYRVGVRHLHGLGGRRIVLHDSDTFKRNVRRMGSEEASQVADADNRDREKDEVENLSWGSTVVGEGFVHDEEQCRKKVEQQKDRVASTDAVNECWLPNTISKLLQRHEETFYPKSRSLTGGGGGVKESVKGGMPLLGASEDPRRRTDSS